MRQLLRLVSLLLCVCFAGQALAKDLVVGDLFKLTPPKDWEQISSDYNKKMPLCVKGIFDGADTPVEELRLMGWLRDAEDFCQAAFTVGFRSTGAKEFTDMMRESPETAREKLAADFSAKMGDHLALAYEAKRHMTVKASGVEFLEAGKLYLLLEDAIITDETTTWNRAGTVFFSGDAIVSILYIYSEKLPQSEINQLEAMITSVTWKD